MKIVIGITGASGAQYGIRLSSELCKAGERPDIIVSSGAKAVMGQECRGGYSKNIEKLKKMGKIWDENDFSAPFASGSNPPDAVVICPCSMKTLSAVANDYEENLIVRAAAVAAKENKKLVLVPMEMPFSALALENMLKLARLGVVIMPPAPGLYHRPKTADEMIGFVVMRIMDEIGVKNKIFRRWGE